MLTQLIPFILFYVCVSKAKIDNTAMHSRVYIYMTDASVDFAPCFPILACLINFFAV